MNLEKQAEKIVLKVIIWPFIAGLVVTYFVFNKITIPIKDMLAYASLVFVATSAIFYFFGYYEFLNATNPKADPKKERFSRPLSILFMTVVYTSTVAILAVLLSYLVNQAYAGAHVVRLAAALIGATAAGIATYISVKTAYKTEALSVARNLTLFMFGGLLLSAIAETDPNWYSVSFSYLGMTPSIAAKIFNFTMIFAGFGSLILSYYLFRDVENKISEKKKFAKSENYMKIMFYVMGLGIATVGLVPWAPGIQGAIHTIGADLAGLFFFVIAVLSPKFLPGMQKGFYWLSYMMAAFLAGTYIVFMFGKNALATVEITAFISVFVWIFITLKCLDLLGLEKN